MRFVRAVLATVPEYAQVPDQHAAAALTEVLPAVDDQATEEEWAEVLSGVREEVLDEKLCGSTETWDTRPMGTWCESSNTDKPAIGPSN